MVPATKIHETYRRHLNKVNSKFAQAISASDADNYINEAIDLLYEDVAQRYETHTLPTDHLRAYERRNIPIATTRVDDHVFAPYPEDLYRLLRQYGIGCREGCDENRIINIHISKSNKLTEAVRDIHWEPSFEWKQTIGIQNNTGLDVYVGCGLDIKKIFIDYLRKPSHIAAPSLVKAGCYGKPGYIDYSGKKITKDVDFDNDNTFFWRKVAKLAAIATMIDQGEKDWQSQLSFIMKTEEVSNL